MSRWRLLSALVGSAALFAGSTLVIAQEDAPATSEEIGHGMVVPGTQADTGSTPDLEAPTRWWNDPTLTPLERTDAAIRARAKFPNCRYGPVERRIPYERLQQMFKEFEKLPGKEAWALLQAEPDDPNSAPLSIAIPSETGPNCPESNINESLLEERGELQRDLARAPERSTGLPDRVSREQSTNPVSVSWFGRDSTDLQWVEAILRGRAFRGLDRLPDCYYGPLKLRIPPPRMNELVEQARILSGEESWRLLLAEPQDAGAEPLIYIVRAGLKPDCPAGDIDERLRQERQRLLDEQSEE